MTKNKFIIPLGIVVILSLVLGLSGITLTSQAAPEPLARKIVVFKSGVLNEPAREALMGKFGVVKIKDLSLIDGKAVLLPPRVQAALAKAEGVLRIDDDVIVEALEKSVPNNLFVDLAQRFENLAIKAQASQTLPWGIARIDADDAWSFSTGDPIKVAIIDTGVNLTHPDLVANIKGGYNAIYPWRTANDDNGHGSHVAGIVAALNNTIGVVGVGPKIDLYAVKVLNAAGSGYLSDVIEGIDWAIQNKIQVINLSLGTTADIQSFRDAVIRVNQAGIVQVAAAGNDGKAINYPAAYDEVIAVSATDQNNAIASWSSRGSQIDLAAPGVSIYSTYKNQSYATLSGTSMAAPHVTGVAALVLDRKTCGSCTPDEVQKKLQATATDLGASGFDNLFGWGLVNAFRAVQ